MDAATLSSLIVLLTPFLTGLIKKLIPWYHEDKFKRFIPVIPPLVGAVLGIIGDFFGIVITPELNNAATGLVFGCVGSSGYDAFKANKKKK